MPEWILHGMPSAIALTIIARLVSIRRRKQNRRKPMARSKDHDDVLFEQLTFEQLRRWHSEDRIDFDTTSGAVFRIADSTPVKGFSVSLPKLHIPRESLSVTMCRGNSVIVCLSQDKQILMLQRKTADDRYVLYFLEASTDRTLEESYSILSDLAVEEPVLIPRAATRRSMIGRVIVKERLASAARS
jgi:hypothetical protein